MRYLRHFRQLRVLLGHGLGAAAVAGALWVAGPAPAQAPAYGPGATKLRDPVEELRRALRAPARNATEAELRKKTLDKRIAALRDTAEMRGALELQDWREEPSDEIGRAVDVPLRAELEQRFEKTLRDALNGDNPLAQLAAASLMAEIGPGLRSAGKGPQERPGLRRDVMRNLAPDLVKLVQRSKDPVVRAAAARALGKINAPVLPLGTGRRNEVVPTLGQLLATGDQDERRAAAAGLLGLIRGATQLIRGKTATLGSEVPAGQAVAVAKVIVPAVGPGARDADVEVRRLAVQALLEAAVALRDRVADARLDFPQGREWTDEEKQDFERYKKDVAEEWDELRPLAEELRAEGKDLIAALNDSDPQVRLVARRAVEELGLAKTRLQRRADSLEMAPKGTGALPHPADVADRRAEFLAQAEPPAGDQKPLREGLENTVPALIRGLNDPDVHARRAAAEALESLGATAAPAVPALTRALGDRDLFVRWIVVRALGKLGAKQSADAIPAMARLLRDPDLDVRVEAATALGRFGAAAEAAVPSLITAVGSDDATLVDAAIKALININKDVDQVVAALIQGLSARDPKIRRSCAEALSKFGPAARDATEVLRARLSDPDADVRKAAGDALLSVTRGR
jgi:HEAT repeat protein